MTQMSNSRYIASMEMQDLNTNLVCHSEHRRPKLIACILYANFGSEQFIGLCMGIYQIFQNGRI